MNGKRTALITGANKGIGLETARQLGQRGMTVLVGARDHERGTRAVETLRSEGLDARLIDLDVTDAASIKQCVMLSLLDDDGPTGGFFDARGRLP